MTRKVLIADHSVHDTERLGRSVSEAGLSFELCNSGAELAQHLNNEQLDWAAIVILWDLPGPPFGPELLARCRRLLPSVPLVVVSDSLDASLATRAHALGANDFLQAPLEPSRIKSCFDSLLNDQDSYLPNVTELNKRILGKSPALLATLRQVARIIQHRADRILVLGESGTGKELLAQALHDLSSDPHAPFVAFNVTAIPKDLIESALFGHEKGAFTGATDLHRGYMEEAGTGTLFMDEFGELDLSLQAKLLRVIQEKKFRRLKGTKEIDFKARLICATNRDLAADVKEGSFRRDLFHRIAEVTIQVPPLRERSGDLDELLNYFLKLYGSNRKVQLERETLTILQSYTFEGNIRELENIVKMALIECDGEIILPRHLPLPLMRKFLKDKDKPAQDTESQLIPAAPATPYAEEYEELVRELINSLPTNWEEEPYKNMAEKYQHAFDRIYLQKLIERHRYNITKATKAAKIDKKTFDKHWEASGLPPRRPEAREKTEEMATTPTIE